MSLPESNPIRERWFQETMKDATKAIDSCIHKANELAEIAYTLQVILTREPIELRARIAYLQGNNVRGDGLMKMAKGL